MNNLYILLLVLAPIIFVLISYVLWKLRGHNVIGNIDNMEKYPPNLNSMDFGFFYKSYADSNDMVSLILYFASKGYIKIANMGDYFKIIKLKEYDGNDENEKTFYDSLFIGDNYRRYGVFGYTGDIKIDCKVDDLHTEATYWTLVNNFYNAMIKLMLSFRRRRNSIILPSSKNNKYYIWLMIVLSVASIYASIYLLEEKANISMLLSFLPTLFFVIIISYFENKFNAHFKISSIIIGFIIFALLLNSLPELSSNIYKFSSSFTNFISSPFHLIFIIFNVIDISSVIGMFVFYSDMLKRTEEANKILIKIIEFKEFIKNVEVDELESYINSNPTYYYDILPYVYSLKLFDYFSDKVKTISMNPPSWYEYSGKFDITEFNEFIKKSMKEAKDAMTYDPYENVNVKF